MWNRELRLYKDNQTVFREIFSRKLMDPVLSDDDLSDIEDMKKMLRI